VSKSLEQETMPGPAMAPAPGTRQGETDGRVAREAIPRRAHTDTAPPSFAQQRLWFIEQLEPGTHVYNSARAVRLRGPLDGSVLRRSLDALVVRHEALRTSFRAVDGLPVQVIAPSLSLPLPIADLG
jgi:hypothetical protein